MQLLSLSQLLKNLVSYLSFSSLQEMTHRGQLLLFGFAYPSMIVINDRGWYCNKPSGNYQNSCSFRITAYNSSDPNITLTCHLAATCSTFAGLPRVKNSFFYPASPPFPPAYQRIIAMENRNGTLISGTETAILAEELSTLGQEHKIHPACPPDEYAYYKHFSLTTDLYTSSDYMLRGTRLCEGKIKLKNEEISYVYFAVSSPWFDNTIYSYSSVNQKTM